MPYAWNNLVMFILFVGSIPAYVHSQSWQLNKHALLDGVQRELFSYGNCDTWARPDLVDIDADGDLDLFVGTRVGRVLFYENRGTTQLPDFQRISPSFYDSLAVGMIPVGQIHSAPYFADIDSDGDYDMFIGWGTNGGWGGTVIYYRNDGSPQQASWTHVTDTLAEVDAWDFSVPVLADIDADQDLDLFIGEGYGTIYFIENIGTPFQPVWGLVDSNYFNIDVRWKATPAFWDANDDGDLDLFVGNDWGEIRYFENTGSDTAAFFSATASQQHFAGVNFEFLDFVAPTFGDLNGDGLNDLIVGEDRGNLNLYRHTGSIEQASWKWIPGDPRKLRLDPGNFNHVVTHDLDLDGDLDILIGHSNGRIQWVRNNGTDLQPNWHIETDTLAGVIYRRANPPRIWTPIFSVADITGDSLPEIIIRQDRNTSTSPYFFYYHAFTGTLQNPAWSSERDTLFTPNGFLPGTNYMSMISLGDVDGDQDLDIIFRNDLQKISYYENIGGSFVPLWDSVTNDLDSTMQTSGKTPLLKDINKDGRTDLLLFGYNSVHTYINQTTSGQLSFTELKDYLTPVPTGNISNPMSTDLWDPDHDCDWDVIQGTFCGGVLFWENQHGTLESDLAQDTICRNGDPIQLHTFFHSVLWGGVADSMGVIRPQFLSRGAQNAWYTFKDPLSGCQISDTFSVNVYYPKAEILGPERICLGDTAILQASATLGKGNYYVSWNPISDTSHKIFVFPTQTQQYSLSVTDGQDCWDTTSLVIHVDSIPRLPIITKPGDSILIATPSATKYRWFRNGQEIPGVVDSAIVPQLSGSYQVIAFNHECSSDTSEIINFYLVGIEINLDKILQLYPNPTTGEVQIQGDLNEVNYLEVSILDMSGHQIWHKKISSIELASGYPIDMRNMSSGIYLLTVSTGTRWGKFQIVKE